MRLWNRSEVIRRPDFRLLRGLRDPVDFLLAHLGVTFSEPGFGTFGAPGGTTSSSFERASCNEPG
jgi:hypothetical protein